MGALLGIGLLGLLALGLMRGIAGKKVSTEDGKSALRMAAMTAVTYANKRRGDSVYWKRYQEIIGVPLTGKPDEVTGNKTSAILGYAVKWPTPSKPLLARSTVTRPPPPKPVPARSTVTRPPPPKPVPARSTVTRPPPPKPVPTRSAVTRATPPKPVTARATVIRPTPPRALPARIPASKTPMRFAPTRPAEPVLPEVPTVSDDVLAADSLDKYLRSGGMDRSRVAVYQAKMGGLSADGVAGPKTLARASSILGRELSWPHINAGKDLRAYLKYGGKDKAKIKAYQAQMGELVADGIVGPKTKARYTALTGLKW